jgi:L-ascorbate metabolism protein UlaG (beta-lactamase superfamily)
MNDDPVYLKRNVQVEPLVDQWYAWAHLIPPATAARNITGRHLRIIDSYLSGPQVHAQAVKNPKMLGGPFIDYGGRRVDEIAALRARTKKDRAALLELSAAIDELDNMLQAKATGFTMQNLYESIPACLRGYVELIYDLNNHPSVRFIEPLLYRSPYYQRSAQTLMLSLCNGDDRPFVLSTPRLEEPNLLHWKVPFDDPAIDDLFRLKVEPKPRAEVHEHMGLAPEQRELMDQFLTSEPPRRYQPYTGPGVRWRYFGHACILVEACGVNLLFDPVLSYTYESSISRYTYEDLPDTIDYVLITHNHQDHLLFETLLQLRHKIRHIVVPRNGGGMLQDPSMRLLLYHAGFKQVTELAEMESIDLPNGSITALPFLGEHCDLHIMTKAAYLVKMGKRSLLFGADSCNIEPQLYQHLRSEVPDLDAIFLGMECDGAPLTWLYGPLLTRRLERAMDASRRLAGSDYQQALNIIDTFSCKEAYVYAMGQEPWLNYVMSLKYTETSRPIVESNKLIEECRRRGLQAERLFGEKEILLE